MKITVSFGKRNSQLIVKLISKKRIHDLISLQSKKGFTKSFYSLLKYNETCRNIKSNVAVKRKREYVS